MARLFGSPAEAALVASVCPNEDHEMLGKVLEKLLEVKGHKSKGT